ncbi:hypothetical protein BJX65DRAFT_268662 [Aspergillus insuetus]
MSFVNSRSSVLRIQTIVGLSARLIQSLDSRLSSCQVSTVLLFMISPWEPVAYHGRSGKIVESTPHQRTDSIQAGKSIAGKPSPRLAVFLSKARGNNGQ